jgi:hypothetical protein
MTLIYVFAASKMEGQPVEQIAANPNKRSPADDRDFPPGWGERRQGLTITKWRLPIDDCRFQRHRKWKRSRFSC